MIPDQVNPTITISLKGARGIGKTTLLKETIIPALTMAGYIVQDGSNDNEIKATHWNMMSYVTIKF